MLSRGINNMEIVKHELRAVWVATVNNIDIPKQENPEHYKEAYLKVLETAKSFHMNAIVFQIRPMNDAFYRSSLNPWSEFLTGVQGKDPLWDPLSWMVEETHKHKMEFHAWLNPYRVSGKKVGEDFQTKDELLDSLAQGNFARKRKDLIILDGNGAPILNPGEPEVKQFIVETIDEIITNYDVDAIHFDDYFYPYADVAENDQVQFEKYGLPGEIKNDWRRRNVDEVIKGIHDLIKQNNDEREHKVQFGISPFAIWRNKKTDPSGSDTRGSQCYDEHFADTRKWVKEEWIDYIVPQIYWEIGHPLADYEVLAKWWADVVRGTNVKLYIGLAIYRYGTSELWENVQIIPDQLRLNQSLKEIEGCFVFSYKHLVRTDNDVLNQALTTIKNEFWNE